jgi:hypothetical protein
MHIALSSRNTLMRIGTGTSCNSNSGKFPERIIHISVGCEVISPSAHAYIINIYVNLKRRWSWAGWCMPRIPALRRLRQAGLRVRGQPKLNSETLS